MAQRFEDSPGASAADVRRRLGFSDEELLRDCDADFHRVGGPGGQHRNKNATAVRLRHRPSGLIVSAAQSRSQLDNKQAAVERLREAIALGFRLPPPQTIEWPENVQIHNSRLRVSEHNPNVHQVVGLVLDVFAAAGGQLADAAARLGLTSSSLARFLHDHPKVWAEANRLRAENKLPSLRPPG